MGCCGLWGGIATGASLPQRQRTRGGRKKTACGFRCKRFFGGLQAVGESIALGFRQAGACGLGLAVLFDQAKLAAVRPAQAVSARSMVPMAVAVKSEAAVPSTIWYTVPTLVVAL